MKTLNTMRLACIAIAFILIPSSCARNQVSILDLTLLIDNTDTFNQLSYQDIRPIYDFDRFLWYEHNTKVREVSDVSNGIATEVHLPRGNSNEQTEQMRKNQVRGFLAQTKKVLEQKEFQASDRSQSHIYLAVAQELNQLASQRIATNRVVVISSDMHEHSSLFDVYDRNDRQLLLEHPDSVIRIFNNALALEDLHGLQVVIVHRATPESNEVFSHMARLYQIMLGLKGAKVFISGSFNPSDLNYQLP